MSILDQEPVIMEGFDAPEYVVRSYGPLVLFVDRTANELSRSYWSVYCRSVAEIKKKHGAVKFFISSMLGRGPNSALRKEYVTVVRPSAEDRMAVMTESAMTRAIAQVLATVMSVPTRPFAPSDLKGAIAYLGVDVTPQQLQARVDELRRLPFKG